MIDPSKLRAEVVHEPGTHGEVEDFPHLYGHLDPDAVAAVVAFPPLEDGSFELPADLPD